MIDFVDFKVPKDIGQLMTTVNAFAESLDYADMWRSVSGTFVIAPEPALPKSAANLKEGSTNWEWTGMEISEVFPEMYKPNNEKCIIVFKYFCSFIGLRFNLKKTFQQKDSVGGTHSLNFNKIVWQQIQILCFK